MTQQEEDKAPAPEVDPFAGLVPGRIVHYHPQPYEVRNCAPGPWAAIVTAVSLERPGVVTLNLQMPEPAQVGEDPVNRLRYVSYGDADGCWSWIPR